MQAPYLFMIATIAFGGAVARGWTSPTTLAARFIPAEIRFDGVPLLKGSTSDNGRADVDAVWDYQRAQLCYVPEPGFAALGVAPGAAEFKLVSAPRPEGRGARRLMQVVLDVGYGGEVSTYELRLVRVPGSAEPGTWRVTEDELERLFPNRSLTRRQAAELEHPKRLK